MSSNFHSVADRERTVDIGMLQRQRVSKCPLTWEIDGHITRRGRPTN